MPAGSWAAGAWVGAAVLLKVLEVWLQQQQQQQVLLAGYVRWQRW
jgi:hypothetical protein